MKRCLGLVVLAAALTCAAGRAQFEPPAANVPDAATLATINAKTKELAKAIALTEWAKTDPHLFPEIDIYLKAAQWLVRHQEYYHKDAAKWTLTILDQGLERVAQLKKGEKPWRFAPGQDVTRAYRSKVDGSAQPYSIALPADYGKDGKKKWRLDVILHGRDASLSEVKFLNAHSGKAAPKDLDHVRLEIFGRTNNAYRWAGETDVFEAIASFLATEKAAGRDLIDPRRIVLRGFSMGGAGTWHLGLHHPDRWCVLGPGAGFTTTHGYVGNLPKELPDHQERCLHIYDAVDYAENAANVPVVAYGGTADPQLQASRNIEERLKKLNIPMTHLIAEGLGHTMPAEWQKKAEAEYVKYAGEGKGRDVYPPRVRFVTHTLKYPRCDWVEVVGLDKHYEPARVDGQIGNATQFVKTQNVSDLRIHLHPQSEGIAELLVTIDGQEGLTVPAVKTPAGTLALNLSKRGGKWQPVARHILPAGRKAAGLQGPIDDAFTDAFLCVRGTGGTWHDATQKYVAADLGRFEKEWDKFLRGQLPVKNDTEITDADIAGKNLILFGDPSSNALMARVLPKLPVKWTKETIALGDKEFAAEAHVPVLIYPNPLNPKRYVVINSGHTFHAADFRGTNALLYPRLGDYAVLKLAAGKDPLAVEVPLAGLFDDDWQIGK